MKATILRLILVCSCAISFTTSAELGKRPSLPPDAPDFTKGEAPAVSEVVNKGDWYLHCGHTRGWIHRNLRNKGDEGWQILVTKVPETSSVRRELKVGDVILGVDGKYFTEHAVYRFRRTSAPANKVGGQIEVILWRKGWDKEKLVTLDLKYKPLDLTIDPKPRDAHTFNMGPTGAFYWAQGRSGETIDARQMVITNVVKDGPSDGILQKGDVILGVGGKAFSYDCRRAMADAINRAETKEMGGKLSVQRWRAGKVQDVVIPLRVMGSYSKTTPWECEKSEKILQEALEHIIKIDLANKHRAIDGRSNVAALALMSTGEPEHFELAKKRVLAVAKMIDESGKNPEKWSYATWGYSYANVMLCEYYLITKDETVFPAITKLTARLAEGQSAVGTWGHNFAEAGNKHNPGYGAMNQCGNVAWLSLNLAKRCGVSHPYLDTAILKGKQYLDTFIDSRTVPYGDTVFGYDSRRYDDNGKNSTAAMGFGVNGDEAGISYYSRMVVASYTWREWGHTGVWWSLLWGPLAANLSGQKATTAFLNEMGWLHDLERRYDGSFIYQPKVGVAYGFNAEGRQKIGAEHTTPYWDTTACRILMYCLPRKQLVITGRDISQVELSPAEVVEVIESGRPGPDGNRNLDNRYNDYTPAALLGLLSDWSPPVRTQAARALGNKPNKESLIPAIIPMLQSDNRLRAIRCLHGLASHWHRLR